MCNLSWTPQLFGGQTKAKDNHETFLTLYNIKTKLYINHVILTFQRCNYYEKNQGREPNVTVSLKLLKQLYLMMVDAFDCQHFKKCYLGDILLCAFSKHVVCT